MIRLPACKRVSAGGGAVTELTRPDTARGEQTHVWPEMVAGAQAVLFTITPTTGGLDGAQVAVLNLVTGKYNVLIRGGSDAHYVPGGLGAPKRPEGGHLVYVKRTTLEAIPFDSARLEIRGTSVMVLPRLAIRPIGSGDFDVAADGTLVYVDTSAGGDTVAARTLVWVDRQGREEPMSASLPTRPYAQPRVSPDGKLVALGIADQENDIWGWDLAGQTPLRQLTSGPALDFFPVWTPDSHRIIFARPGGGLFWQSADGTGKAEALSNTAGAGMLPSGVTPDGTRVLYSLGARDLMMMTLDTRRVEPLIQTPFDERNGVVSRDGRWLAYESKSSGQFEIYVTPFPNVNAAQWTISMAGGTRPLWAPNGQELFFVAPDGAIMAVRVDVRGGSFSAGTPAQVVAGPYATGAPTSGRNYDVSIDGKRFLMVKQAPSNQAAAPRLEIVQHWSQELKRLAPATP